MYCRNCGVKYENEQAVICTNCNAPKYQGTNYCWSCQTATTPDQSVCSTCGVSLVDPAQQKSKMAAGLLGIFLGAFGVHNFYLGYTTKAIIQLVCTIVGFILSCIVVGAFVVLGIEIWGLVEGIMILCGKISVDGKGVPLKD